MCACAIEDHVGLHDQDIARIPSASCVRHSFIFIRFKTHFHIHSVAATLSHSFSFRHSFIFFRLKTLFHIHSVKDTLSYSFGLTHSFVFSRHCMHTSRFVRKTLAAAAVADSYSFTFSLDSLCLYMREGQLPLR